MKTKSKLSHDQKRNSVVVRALQTVARPNQWNKNALVLGLVAALGTGYFLHSTSDQVVKISMSQRLGRAAEKPADPKLADSNKPKNPLPPAPTMDKEPVADDEAPKKNEHKEEAPQKNKDTDKEKADRTAEYLENAKEACESSSIDRCLKRFTDAVKSHKKDMDDEKVGEFFQDNISPKITEKIEKIGRRGFSRNEIRDLKTAIQTSVRSTPSKFRYIWKDEITEFANQVKETVNDEYVSKLADSKNPYTQNQLKSLISEFGFLPTSTFGESFGGVNGQDFATAKARCMLYFQSEFNCATLAAQMVGYNAQFTDLLNNGVNSTKWNSGSTFEEGGLETVNATNTSTELADLKKQIEDLKKQLNEKNSGTTTTTTTAPTTPTTDTTNSQTTNTTFPNLQTLPIPANTGTTQGGTAPRGSHTGTVNRGNFTTPTQPSIQGRH